MGAARHTSTATKEKAIRMFGLGESNSTILKRLDISATALKRLRKKWETEKANSDEKASE